jgi:hypothetical protein
MTLRNGHPSDMPDIPVAHKASFAPLARGVTLELTLGRRRSNALRFGPHGIAVVSENERDETLGLDALFFSRLSRSG